MSMVLSEKELQELHDVLLDAMVQFDVVCKENGIQYFLGGGTLLGESDTADLSPGTTTWI